MAGSIVNQVPCKAAYSLPCLNVKPWKLKLPPPGIKSEVSKEEGRGASLWEDWSREPGLS